jgi:hypothetical protein
MNDEFPEVVEGEKKKLSQAEQRALNLSKRKSWTKENHPPGRWKKGMSGNPTGRRGDGLHPGKLYKLGESRLSALIESELAQDDGKKAKALAAELVKRAIEGDPFATKAVLDRVDGAVEKKVNINATMTQQMVQLLDAPRPAVFELSAEVMPTPAEAQKSAVEEALGKALEELAGEDEGC